MFKKYLAAAGFASLAMVWALSAQSPLQTVINNSMKAMGLDSVKTLTILGEGGDGAVGQQLDPHSDYWRWYSNKNFIRSYDFDAKGYRTQRTRGEGNVPAGGGNGTTTPAPIQEQNQVTMATAFNAQMEMAMTPIGFLKMAAEKNATVAQKTELGKKYTVLSYPMDAGAGAATYKTTVNGYIDEQGLVQKVETTISHDFLGDISWRAEFTDWKTFGGVKFPAHIVQRQGDPKLFELMVSDVKVNQPVDLTAVAGKAAPGGPGAGKGAPGGAKGGPGGPGAGKGGPAVVAGGPGAGKGGPGGAGPGAAKGGNTPVGADTEDLGGGFWLLRGGYASVIADFKDYIMILEGPTNEARGELTIAEAHRLIPNKPIRYVISSHYHFDHTSGLRGMVAEGATIVVHEGNQGLYEKALSTPHTLVPDKMQKMAKQPKVKVEYVGETKIFTDGVHVVETHHIQGGTHNMAELVFYLPKQKILIEADEFNVGGQIPPAPLAAPNFYQVNFLKEMQRMKLDVDRFIPIHLPGDNRKVTLQELRYMAGVQ